jgi:sugar/nucleoside kinase (ribokinase family)
MLKGGEGPLKDVVSLSSLNVDYLYEAEDLSFLEPFFPEGGYRRQWTIDDPDRAAPLHRVLEEKARLLTKSAGGSGANAVYCLAKMGFASGLMGKIGGDEEGEFLLKENGIVPFRRLVRNEKTGISLIVLGPSRDRTIIRIPNANRTLSWDDVDLDFLFPFSILHLTSLPGDGLQIQIRVVEELVGRMDVAFDPGETYVRKGLTALWPILRRCRWLFITEGELETLSGTPFPQAVSKVQASGVRTLVIKRKGAGATIINESGAWDLPAEPVKAVDTTGAGDVFAAAFLAGVLKGLNPLECGRLALTLSRQSMLGLGRTAYPNREDFEKTLGGIGLKREGK